MSTAAAYGLSLVPRRPEPPSERPSETPPSLRIKTCSKCLRTKPVTEFSRNRRARDGLCGQCKFCQREYRRRNAVRARTKARGTRSQTAVGTRSKKTKKKKTKKTKTKKSNPAAKAKPKSRSASKKKKPRSQKGS